METAVREQYPQYDNQDTASERHPFRRRIMREDITIRIKNLRLDSGEKIQLVYGAPKKAKLCPTVFVLDVESNSIANRSGIGFPGMSKRAKDELKRAGYLLKSPFGSNLLGNGFAVAYIVGDDLQSIRSARTNDWLGIFERVRGLKQVDPNSLFLLSTREYANLSVYLASKYTFSGFILEEPSYLLFSRQTYENVIERSDDLSPEEIWSRTDPSKARRYVEIFSQIHCPIMLIRNEQSDAYAFNDKTLIPKMYEANAYVEQVKIDGPVRNLTTFGSGNGVIDLTPEVSYYVPNVSLWVDEMITYIRMNSSTEAVALRDPSKYRSW